jgi:hypothetical protein
MVMGLREGGCSLKRSRRCRVLFDQRLVKVEEKSDAHSRELSSHRRASLDERPTV